MTTDSRIVIVTGANRGIGLELCRQLAAQHFIVLLGSRDAEKGKQAAAALKRDNVIPHQLDVTDLNSVHRLRDYVQSHYGRLDVLINNAAILYDPARRASTVDLDSVRDALETNTIGAWQMCQAFIPLLKKSRHPRIVNVSSEAGSLASMGAGAPAYNVSKVALNGLTRLLAAELRADRILVNSICPGWVATDMGGSGGRPVKDGAASIMWAVNLPDNGATGGFFRDGKPLAW